MTSIRKIEEDRIDYIIACFDHGVTVSLSTEEFFMFKEKLINEYSVDFSKFDVKWRYLKNDIRYLINTGGGL